MILTTTSEIQNYTITETIGLVSGNMVQSKHVGRDIMAGLKTLVGGEISGYTEMLIEARQQAQGGKCYPECEIHNKCYSSRDV